jgi:hypothetical protein
MRTLKLPELPEMQTVAFDESVCIKAYTADQMESYATAAVLMNGRRSVLRVIIDWITNA